MIDETQEPTDVCCKTKVLTLDEAIAHAEECINDTPCGQMHKQLADWLKELKDYRCFPNRTQRQGLHMSEQMAKEKKWEQCTGGAIAWLGLDVDMDIKEISDWLDALVESGECGFGSGDAFGDSSNSLATWVSSLAEKIRKTDSSRPLRNCDVGKDVRTLLEEYIAMRGFTSDNQIRALYELALPVIEWLLAPAAERKGDGDGR